MWSRMWGNSRQTPKFCGGAIPGGGKIINGIIPEQSSGCRTVYSLFELAEEVIIRSIDLLEVSTGWLNNPLDDCLCKDRVKQLKARVFLS